MRLAGGRAFCFVVVWAAVDGATAAYLHVSGVNAISTSLLVVAVVAFGVGIAVGDPGTSSLEPILLLLVCLQSLLRVVVPYQPDAPSSDRLIPSLALIAAVISVSAIAAVRANA